MKKFISDNLWWMMIAAIAIGAFALYRTYNKKDGDTNTKSLTVETTETAA